MNSIWELGIGPWNDTLQDFSCDLCGYKNEEFLYTIPGTLTNYPFRLVRCRSCGFLYLNPRLNKKAIAELYDRDYYSGKGFDQHINYLSDLSRDDKNSKISRPEETIETLGELKPPPAFHLDFGCGVGDLLGQATKSGYDSEGYEVSRFAREFVQKKGFTVYGHVDEIPADRYDLVSAIEVLEHCSSPFESLRVIYRALKPGGILYYTTCNFDGFYERFRRGKIDRVRDEYIKPEGHIHFFSTAVMESYFRKIGFSRSFRFAPRHYVREGRLFSLLSRAGLVGQESYPATLPLKVAYYGSRSLAVILGIRKPSLPLAQK